MRPFDGNGEFQPSVDERQLRHLAVRGAGATVLCSAAGLVIQILATVVLARLLTPADFGLVTMVTTFSLLLVNFGLNGFTEAVVQRETISHSLASNLFWINVVAGVVLTIAFAASGSLMKRFYDNPQVAYVALGISLTIFISSTSVLHLALLKRAMRFSALSANDIIAAVVSVLLSIILGWAGWGYRALIAGAVVRPLIQSIGAWVLCRWIPGMPARVNGTGRLVRFGMNIYGRFVINYFARNMDNVLVGWRFNAQVLGFYKKAYDLFALSSSQLVAPLTSVAVSALSRLAKDPTQYRRYLLNAISVLAFAGMGLGALLTLSGRDVIRLLLGPGWEPAEHIFTFFGPGIGIMLLYGTHGWIHLSIGRADRWFRWVIVEFVVTGLLFILGLAWGPAGIALAWTGSFWILFVPAFWYAGRPISLGIAPILAAVWKYLVASLLAGGGFVVIITGIPSLPQISGGGGAFIRILITCAIFGSLYIAAVVLLHGGWSPVRQITGLLREMMPMGAFRTSPVVAVSGGVQEAILP